VRRLNRSAAPTLTAIREWSLTNLAGESGTSGQGAALLAMSWFGLPEPCSALSE
jgi:hypothetical protein